MSYSHGGGGRRYGPYRDDRRRDREPQHPPERPETRLQTAIIKFGDEITRDPQDEIPRMLAFLQSNQIAYLPAIAEGLKIGVVEQPYKIPYYALLVAHFITPPLKDIEAPSSTATSNSELAKHFLDDFFKGFQGFVDKQAWREIRLCIHMFGHLTLLRIISPSSMISLLQSFITVLNEPGVSHYRARNSALTAGEGLLRAGTLLYEHSSETVDEMIASLKSFSESYPEEKALVAPIVQLYSTEVEEIDWKESVACLISALLVQQSNSFTNSPASLPPIERKAPYYDGVVYDLPFVLVPPEVIELDDGLAASPPMGELLDGTVSKQPAKQDYPYVYLSLFPEDITPSDSTPAGYIIRSCILDMLNLFEVNRKECARILLELYHWWEPSTFKGGVASLAKEDDETNDETAEVMGWSLENTVIESILSTSFLLPISPHLQIYYYALITDLCKASPQTVGPAVGKSIRKLYKLLGEGLDVEVARKFAEWFAIHMSNFAFNWVWREWAPDLSLPDRHPKKEFIRSSIQLETRLAYYDRIKGSLPEEFHSPEAGVLPQEAPGPSFDFEAPDHPYYDSAESLLALIRGRSKSDAVVQHAESMRHQIAESFSVSLPHASSIVRTIAVQCILHTGSRSFSHFLNAIERYLPLLRAFSNHSQTSTSDISGSQEEARAEILETVAKFWNRNPQMVGIVFDKLMQYQIVDPADIVSWAFKGGEVSSTDEGPKGLNTSQWVLLRAALDKATGRVEIAKGKVAAVKKAEEDTKSRAKARAAGIGGESEMEVEVDDAILEDDSAQSPKLANALKAHATLTRDQKTALAKALDGFVSTLGTSSGVHPVLSQENWDARDAWSHEWKDWETWCWYRQFCRMYAPQLKIYINTLESVALSRLDSTTDTNKNAAQLMRSIWRVALSSET